MFWSIQIFCSSQLFDTSTFNICGALNIKMWFLCINSCVYQPTNAWLCHFVSKRAQKHPSLIPSNVHFLCTNTGISVWAELSPLSDHDLRFMVFPDKLGRRYFRSREIQDNFLGAMTHCRQIWRLWSAETGHTIITSCKWRLFWLCENQRFLRLNGSREDFNDPISW